MTAAPGEASARAASAGDPAADHARELRRDLGRSIAIIALVVAFALVGLAADGNWPKLLRVALSFSAYAGTLLAWRRADPSGPATLPFHWFASAGAAAGLVSGLVRPEFHWSVLLAGTAGAALLLGGMHWLGLAYWRRVRAGIAGRVAQHLTR